MEASQHGETFPAVPPADPMPIGTDEATSESERQQADAEREVGQVGGQPPASEPQPEPESERERQLDDSEGKTEAASEDESGH